MAANTAGSVLRLPGSGVDDVRAQVLSNERVNDTYNLLVVAAPGPASRAVAGQFFHLQCPTTDRDAPYLRRPMSTYRAEPQSGVVEFLYKVSGAGTRGLASLEAGDYLSMLGPLGVGFALEPDWRHIVVLGRGVGLATLAPLAEMAAARNIGVTAVISARDQDQVLSVPRFADIGAHVEIVLDSDGSSSVDNVERLLRRCHAEGHADAFFTCGSNRLMLLMQRLGDELGIAGQVAMEQQMACGLGMCHCCVRDFRVAGETVSRRVCWDGPVFALAEATSW